MDDRGINVARSDEVAIILVYTMHHYNISAYMKVHVYSTPKKEKGKKEKGKWEKKEP